MPSSMLQALAGETSVLARINHERHFHVLDQLHNEKVCNGNGVCMLARHVNEDRWGGDSWDGNRLTACKCDYPYYGSQCQHRHCPRGDDPVTECGDSDRAIPGGRCTGEQHGQVWEIKYRFGTDITRPGDLAFGFDLSAKLKTVDGFQWDSLVVHDAWARSSVDSSVWLRNSIEHAP